MTLSSDYKPEFKSLIDLLVEMAQERSLDNLLKMIVHRFAQRPHLALARIWLIRPGDNCESCAMSKECFNRTNCLHLVASAGRPETNSESEWSQLDDRFSRWPIGHEAVGKIASTGEPFEIPDLEKVPQWFAETDWVRKEGILGFSGEPLVYRGEVMGAFAIFVRIKIPNNAKGRGWLRLVADHAATAIANARAFDEIERLRCRLELENAYLREEVREASAFDQIIGQSSALDRVRQQIELVALTDASVLIQGETGTGKELVAREIHRQSLRRGRPMIKVNCPSIPSELWESEFFGHIKGAFTGAIKDRAGRFELADEGTLFLDEVGEIPLDLQSRLLRVLQEGQFERIGDEVTRKVNVRIVAASNKDLESEISEGRFRQDLYYRLNVFPIHVPPLTERKEDIPLLAQHFIKLNAHTLNRYTCRLSEDDYKFLMSYSWPGNVRELKNIIERAMITAQSDTLDLSMFNNQSYTGRTFSNSQMDHVPFAASQQQQAVITMSEMKQREEDNLLAALNQTRWKIYGPGGAAELLGIKPTTLCSRIKKAGYSRT